MKLEEQVCSIELAKRLKKLGIEQESLFAWARVGRDFELVITDEIDVMDRELPITVHEGTKDEGWHAQECYAAFTVAELGELLPPGHASEKLWAWSADPWVCAPYEAFSGEMGKTEAEARAKMLIARLEQEGVDNGHH